MKERIINKNESKYFNTAKKMNDALLSLLEKKEFEFITIKDICKEAKVNRSTFYLHYENINDLLDEAISNSNEAFYKAFESIKRKDVNSSKKEELIFISDDYLLPYLDFIKEHRKIYKAAMKNSSLFKADEITSLVYKELIVKIFDKFSVSEEYRRYLFDYFVAGIQAMIARWLKNDCDLEVQELANLIKKLVKNNERASAE